MRIAQLAPLWKCVPPLQYGGSELVVSLLTEELVRQGHDVTLFASADSQTAAKLQAVIEKPIYDTLGRFDFTAIQPADLVAFDMVAAAAEQGKFDIIHNHMGMHIALLGKRLSVPMLTTNHSSVAPDFPDIAQRAADANYVSISNAQRKNAPYLHYVETVYHGIDVDKFVYNDTPDDYLLFLGTLSMAKGVDRAVEIARQTKKRLILAGEVRDQTEFDAIKPYIDGEQIRFLGEVDFATKIELFREASAYLLPLRWNEAFGLTVVEALASGTPVIAWPNGAMPEIIENGKVGFLVSSVDEACQAVANIAHIDRSYCRSYVKERFDMSTMAKNYVAAYTKVMQ